MIPKGINLFKMFKVGLQIIHQTSFDWRFFLLLASLSMLHWTKGSGVQGAYFHRINCMKSSSLHSSIKFSKTSSNVLNCAMHCNKESSVFFLFRKTDKRCACTDYIEHLPRQSPDICSESTADVSVYVKNDDNDITNCDDKLPLGSKNERIRILTDGSFVKCDPMKNGAGWIVVQNRESEVDFDRGWDDYVHGFGSLSGNFWFGLDRIHRLCSKKCQMRFTFEYQGDYWAEYNVTIDGPSDNYKLHISDGFDGTASDSLRDTNNTNVSANGMMFSTKDNDHDTSISLNCAAAISAWWSNACQSVSPNGIWGGFGDKAMFWRAQTSSVTDGVEYLHSVNKIKIRVRPLV